MFINKKKTPAIAKVVKKKTATAAKPSAGSPPTPPPPPPIKAWFAIGYFIWSNGRLTARFVKKDGWNTRYTKTGYMPTPDYYGKTTDDIRLAMRWNSAQAARKWSQARHNASEDGANQIINLKQFELTPEILNEVEEKATTPAEFPK